MKNQTNKEQIQSTTDESKVEIRHKVEKVESLRNSSIVDRLVEFCLGLEALGSAYNSYIYKVSYEASQNISDNNLGYLFAFLSGIALTAALALHTEVRSFNDRRNEIIGELNGAGVNAQEEIRQYRAEKRGKVKSKVKRFFRIG